MCETIGDFYDNLLDCIDRHEKNYNEDDGMFLRFHMRYMLCGIAYALQAESFNEIF